MVITGFRGENYFLNGRFFMENVSVELFNYLKQKLLTAIFFKQKSSETSSRIRTQVTWFMPQLSTHEPPGDERRRSLLGTILTEFDGLASDLRENHKRDKIKITTTAKLTGSGETRDGEVALSADVTH